MLGVTGGSISCHKERERSGMSQLDEQVITRAAEEAINSLQLNCRVEKVFQHPRHKEKWCIQFTGEYGQFCNEFRNHEGQQNSPELIREKVKSFFLKMRKPVRIRRGSSHQVSGSSQESILSAAPLEIVGQAIDQTTRLVGDVINQVSGLARSALETEAVVSVELPTIVPQPRARKSRKTGQPSKRKAVKKSSGKTTRKVSSRTAQPTSSSSKAAKKSGRKKQAAVARTKKSGKKRG